MSPPKDDYQDVASFLQEDKGLTFGTDSVPEEGDESQQEEKTPLDEFREYVENNREVRARVEQYYWELKYGKRPYYYAIGILGVLALAAVVSVYQMQFSDTARIRKNIADAFSLVSSQDYRLAEEYVQRAVRLGADPQNIYSQLVLKALEQNNLVQAETYFKQLKAVAGEIVYPQTVYVEARLSYEKGMVSRARMLIEKVLVMDPQHIEAKKLAGIIAFRADDLEKAEEMFTEIVSVRSDDFGSLYYLYEISRKRKQWRKLKEVYDLILQLDYSQVRDVNELENLGSILVQAENYDKAIRVFERVIELRPNSWKGLYNLSLLYLAKGENRQAMNLANLAIRKDPSRAEAYNVRGEIYYYKKNDLVKAIEDFKSCLRMNPYYPKVHFNLAQIYYYETSDYEHAIKEYKRALELGFDPGVMDEVTYNLAYSYYQTGRFATALSELEKLMERRKDDLNLKLTAGNMALLSRDFLKARKLYDYILERVPKTSGILNNLALASYLSGDRKEGLRYMWEAVRLTPKESEETEFYSRNLSYMLNDEIAGKDERTLLYQKFDKYFR